MRWWLVIGLIAIAGCGATKLETGYEPRRFGDSDTIRRGYYAAPFTPEAKAAAVDQQQQQQQELDSRRPRPD